MTDERKVRYTLGGLLALVAINAFGGGWYGLRGAKGVPLEWLRGSPFASYTVPSAILFFVVGGAFLAAAIAVFARARPAPTLAGVAGGIAGFWIAAELAVIGFVSWLQPLTVAAAVLVIVLAANLRARTT